MSATRFYSPDGRVAMGAKPLRPGQPAECCAYCWPRLIQADLYDDAGHAACLCCAGNPDRERSLPNHRGSRWEELAA